MANDIENETVEQSLSKLTSRLLYGKPKSLFPQEVKSLMDNILAAHKREIESLKWKVENYAQVVAAKDSEIEDFMKRIAVYEEVVTENGGRFLKQDAEIAKLRATVKELADALKKIDEVADGDMCKHLIATEHCSKCEHLETCETGIAHNALITNETEIAKAREVVK